MSEVRRRMNSPTGYDNANDEQVTGPFRHWRHAHHFEPGGNGGTVMRDIVNFAAPLGPLGTIAVLNWYMPRLIRIRNDHLKAAAEAADPDTAS